MTAIPSVSRRFSSEFHGVQEGFKCLSSRKPGTVFPANDDFRKTNTKQRISFSGEEHHGKRAECFQTRFEGSDMFGGCNKPYSLRANLWSTSCQEDLCPVCYALESDSIKQHQKSLDTYLDKVQRQTENVMLNDKSDISELDDQGSQLQAMKGLRSLERYTAILKQDAKQEECMLSTYGRNTSGASEDSAVRYIQVAKQKRNNVYARNLESSLPYDVKESANLYLISTLLSMNIAVFLFEIASPIKGSDYDLYSLPLMYGAKVNDLIMVGEWWRLLTPMFLHSGLLHIALSSWTLLSFGPQVCRGYGSFTFLLIYLLGGISGNFTSFLHTAEPTVGGSGPVFAVIGAWLIYQIQNKDATGKQNSESLFQKAMIATACSFVLANFGPIDNWANLGAAVSGIIYGFYTCPVDDASAAELGDSIKEENRVSKKPANPCKSLIIFTLFVSAFSSLLMFCESPVDQLQLEELVQNLD